MPELVRHNTLLDVFARCFDEFLQCSRLGTFSASVGNYCISCTSKFNYTDSISAKVAALAIVACVIALEKEINLLCMCRFTMFILGKLYATSYAS